MTEREEKVRELVDRWEDARAEGRDVSAEELCRDAPELVAEVESFISRLEATSWIAPPRTKAARSDESLPSRNDETWGLPRCAVSEFAKRLSGSGLLTMEQANSLAPTLAKQATASDARPLASALIKRGWLTTYQVRTLLSGAAAHLTFGEYVVLDLLGSGGMGQVYKARHRRMDRLVALKVMSAAALGSPAAVARFHREVKAAAKLVHPYIVTAYDAGEDHGQHFLVMEFIFGRDLSQVALERGPLPLAETLDYLTQAARGLEYAHRQGIVHRDIKPANLLLDSNGTVKILDMGLARVEQADASSGQLTQSGQVMGTVEYMAPEQGVDIRRADSRSDVYSLGCTLYRMLTGQVLYSGETPINIVLAHLHNPVPELRVVRPDLPPPFEAIFQKMVAKSPADRYQNMTEVIAALTPYKSQSTMGGGATIPLALADAVRAKPERPSPRKKTPWLVWGGAAGGVFVLVLLVGLSSGWFRQRNPTTANPGADVTASKPTATDSTKPDENASPPKVAVNETPTPPKPAAETAPPNAAAEIVYLDDIPEKAKNVIRHLGKHGLDNDDHVITWKGQRPAHALFSHPHPDSNCWVTYELPENRYGVFRVTAAISEEINDHVSSALTFKIWGDGQLLRQSAPLQHVGDSRDLFARVKGVKQLKLEVVCPGYNGQAHALWLNPRLIPIGALDKLGETP